MPACPSEDSLPPGEVTLDLRGLRCPLPVLHTRRAMERLAPGAIVHVLSTDPLSGLDIPWLIATQGDVLRAQSCTEGVYHFILQKAEPDHAAAR
jgi:tRNA 2-thiouridine synthesizing protein A